MGSGCHCHAYRVAGYFRMVQIFVFFICEPCIRKLNVRKIEDYTTCYVHMRECTKIKHTNFFKNWFVRKFVPTKYPAIRYTRLDIEHTPIHYVYCLYSAGTTWSL